MLDETIAEVTMADDELDVARLEEDELVTELEALDGGIELELEEIVIELEELELDELDDETAVELEELELDELDGGIVIELEGAALKELLLELGFNTLKVDPASLPT